MRVRENSPAQRVQHGAGPAHKSEGKEASSYENWVDSPGVCEPAGDARNGGITAAFETPRANGGEEGCN